eukprot:365536-Chlamydomonas_euryale.AAC.2
MLASCNHQAAQDSPEDPAVAERLQQPELYMYCCLIRGCTTIGCINEIGCLRAGGENVCFALHFFAYDFALVVAPEYVSFINMNSPRHRMRGYACKCGHAPDAASS